MKRYLCRFLQLCCIVIITQACTDKASNYIVFDQTNIDKARVTILGNKDSSYIGLNSYSVVIDKDIFPLIPSFCVDKIDDILLHADSNSKIIRLMEVNLSNASFEELDEFFGKRTRFANRAFNTVSNKIYIFTDRDHAILLSLDKVTQNINIKYMTNDMFFNLKGYIKK